MSEENKPSSNNNLLAIQRTELAFKRTGLGADRTLFAVVRTSLSLISFGFAIFHFFEHIKSHILDSSHHEGARILGFSLAIIGITNLIIGIIFHLKFNSGIKKESEELIRKKLFPSVDEYPVSMSLIVALLLLIVGIVMLIIMLFDVFEIKITH